MGNKTNPKKSEINDGITIKYHANGQTIWSKGKIINDQQEGYWEWYRIDGTIKRSGHFKSGEPVDSERLISQNNLYQGAGELIYLFHIS